MRSFGPRDREPAFPAHVAPFVRMHRHTTRGTDRLSSGREIVEEHAISVVPWRAAEESVPWLESVSRLTYLAASHLGRV